MLQERLNQFGVTNPTRCKNKMQLTRCARSLHFIFPPRWVCSKSDSQHQIPLPRKLGQVDNRIFPKLVSLLKPDYQLQIKSPAGFY